MGLQAAVSEVLPGRKGDRIDLGIISEESEVIRRNEDLLKDMSLLIRRYEVGNVVTRSGEIGDGGLLESVGKGVHSDSKTKCCGIMKDSVLTWKCLQYDTGPPRKMFLLVCLSIIDTRKLSKS